MATAEPSPLGVSVSSPTLSGPRSPYGGPAIPSPAFLVAVGVAGLVAAATTVAVGVTNDELDHVGIRVFLIDWITLNFIGAGLIAWWRRPDSRFGLLMVAAGFVNFLATIGVSPNALVPLAGVPDWATADVAYTIGFALGALPPLLFLHVFLAYPSGRLVGRLDRGVVVGAYVTWIGLGLARMLLGGTGPRNLIEVVSAPGAAAAVRDVQLVGLSAFSLAGIGVLAARRWGAGRSPRRPLGPLVDSFAVGLVMITALFSSIVLVGSPADVPAIETVRRATFFVVGLAPIAFLFGLLRTRLAVGPAIVSLGAEAARSNVVDALRTALRDPSLEVAYWVAEYDAYADRDGSAIELPAGADRATTLLDREDGTHVAALVHDASLREEPELLKAVSAAAGFALENERLHAELRARLEELKGSRARIIEAAQTERQRLERDLHDGAQQRLVALSLELGLLEERFAGDADAKGALEQTRREVTESLRELRELAQGIHPAVVTGHGLAVALKTLAARAQVPVRLTVDLDGRLPEREEVAAYYVVAESLTNVAKYARASSAAVEVRQAEGRLRVEVVDDGVGGADTRDGSGLRGLADRVEALGGRLRVWSPAGAGTRVEAEIPCA
jgi:signal transduction histidine kinase